MRKYRLEAKQYCNCEHAQMLREALEDVVWYLREENPMPTTAIATARHALAVDDEASGEGL